MKALTVWQPWASLIVEGFKPYEFRGWRAHRSIIGQRIVIHSAARPAKHGEIAQIYTALRDGGERAAETCVKPEAAEMLKAMAFNERPIILSAGLGTAIVGEPRNGLEIAEEFGLPRVNDSDRDEHANWGWPMLEIEKWDEPVPMKGMQGIWTWPGPGSVGL